MRGFATTVWFLGVMSVGAIAGVELAHYRQQQLIEGARARAGQPAPGELAKTKAPEVTFGKKLDAAPKPPIPPLAPAQPKPDFQIASSKVAAPPQRPAPQPSPRPEMPVPSPALPPPPAAPSPPSLGSSPPLKAVTEAPPSPLAPELPLKGNIRIVISLPTQRAYVFKDGELWDSSRVSTGRKGKRTPVGTYTILEKALHHRSNKYSNAPMPFMQRITWGGVALHAGVVPGYPASHGCIRLPRSFAKRLTESRTSPRRLW